MTQARLLCDHSATRSTVSDKKQLTEQTLLWFMVPVGNWRVSRGSITVDGWSRELRDHVFIHKQETGNNELKMRWGAINSQIPPPLMYFLQQG